ncbi:protein turtle-like [Clarias gariepinus]
MRFHVLGPSGPLTVQLEGSVMLPCFVKTPLPMKELEVEWKRNDSGSLVHLWQDRESRPESQDQRYCERAHFFTDEIKHGNFSLLLTNVTQEDAGVYKCVVYTNMNYNETLIEIKEIERLIVSGAHVISAYAGEDITLNCSVDSHIIPKNIEEISWRKMDEDILVLLYQEGEVLTDSSHNRYRDRVEFFSTEERNKGNFSLRLKEVRTEDKGLYLCLAFSGTLSDNTSVEVQQLETPAKRAFNVAHIYICNIVERAIGLWKLRFRCLHKSEGGLHMKPHRCCAVTVATAMLHNMALRGNAPLPEEEEANEEEDAEVDVEVTSASEGFTACCRG